MRDPRTFLSFALLLCVVAVAHGAEDAAEKAEPFLTRWTTDAPLNYRLVDAKTGAISGVIENTVRCKGVAALLREGHDPRKPKVTKGTFDPKTGAFRIDGLAPGTYDLRVSVPGGWIDGVDMRLKPWQMTGGKLDADARKAVLEIIENFPPAFMNTHRALAIAGTDKVAKVIVEMIRHTDYHSGRKGDYIWRVELWEFQNFYGGWRKVHGIPPALTRLRATPDGKYGTKLDDFEKMVWLFDPALGGIALRAGKAAAELKYRMPDALTMEMGKVPGSVEKQAAESRKKIRDAEEGP